jgi:hypothetical protein
MALTNTPKRQVFPQQDEERDGEKDKVLMEEKILCTNCDIQTRRPKEYRLRPRLRS